MLLGIINMLQSELITLILLIANYVLDIVKILFVFILNYKFSQA